MKYGSVTIRSLILGAIFSGVFALLTVYFENLQSTYTGDIYVTANQVPVLP